MTAVPDHLTGLNPPQRLAVETLNGPLLILAGAGSGKTRVLTRRIAHLLHTGVQPWRILAVTFTNKAAAEMKVRIQGIVGEEAGKSLWVSTFHSSCARILRQEADHIGLSRNYVVWDDDDQLRVLKRILQDLNLDPKQHPPRGFRSKIDSAKNKLWGPDEWLEHGAEPPGSTAIKVFRAYEARLAASDAVDFNDLINHVVKLFRTRPDRLERWQDRFHYLLVDEYQDTNRAQYELVKMLAAKRRNLAVVGDDDQSIYSFRGADIRNILDFEKDFPNAHVVKLEQNYRSSSRILQAATAVVKRNKDRKEKVLWTEAAEGAPLRVIVARDEDEEARKVAAKIQAGLRAGRSPDDYAVIYRTNARSRPFEQAFRRMDIPHVLVGTRKFYARREVRDILAYLKLVVNPADPMAFARVINVPRRSLGPKAVGRIQEHASRENITLVEATRVLGEARGKQAAAMKNFVGLIAGFREAAAEVTPGELVQRICDETGYRAGLEADNTEESLGRLENLDALAVDLTTEEFTLSEEFGNEPLDVLSAFLDRASLAGQDEEIPDGGRVTLMTTHLAKGLEFPVVFVAGMVEGSFPMTREETEERLEEERRLAYVAFTRAEEELILTRSMMRIVYGTGPMRCTPSRFLDDIPAALIQGHSGAGAAPRRRAPSIDRDEARRRIAAFTSRHEKPRQTAPNSANSDAGAGERRTMIPETAAELRVGIRVLHPDFGEGVIRSASGAPSNPRLTIEFAGHRTRTLFAGYANLEIVVP